MPHLRPYPRVDGWTSGILCSHGFRVRDSHRLKNALQEYFFRSANPFDLFSPLCLQGSGHVASRFIDCSKRNHHVLSEERRQQGENRAACSGVPDGALRTRRPAGVTPRASGGGRGRRVYRHRLVRLLPRLRHGGPQTRGFEVSAMPVQTEVFAAAQTGDRADLEILLLRLRPDIRLYALFQCYRSSVIEDVVQEAMIVVYRRIGTVRNLETLGTWLSRVVARLCALPALMLMRGVEELGSVDQAAYFARMPVDELRIDLSRALESLPPQHREIILLRDFEELTISEIAARLGITREATKSRLHRARLLVREYLMPVCE